jgi:hypothetical protein
LTITEIRSRSFLPSYLLTSTRRCGCGRVWKSTLNRVQDQAYRSVMEGFSYTGRTRRYGRCYTDFIVLAKSCHDMDILLCSSSPKILKTSTPPGHNHFLRVPPIFHQIQQAERSRRCHELSFLSLRAYGHGSVHYRVILASKTIAIMYNCSI